MSLASYYQITRAGKLSKVNSAGEANLMIIPIFT